MRLLRPGSLLPEDAGPVAGHRQHRDPCAHLFNSAIETGIEVQYWLDRNREVDFVLFAGESVTAIEVKSGRREILLPGISAFAKAFPVKRQILVGAQGIPLEEFLTQPAAHWLD